MGVVMPREEVVKRFNKIADRKGLEDVTNWFYDLSKASNYIMTERISKNYIG